VTRTLAPRLTIAKTATGDGGSLATDVLAGLRRRPVKELPPKHFYDERGSQLFDQICTLPEYYPTRTERAILDAGAAAIVARTGVTDLVELGSGMATKTRVLLDAMRDAGQLASYVPFDIDESVVRASAKAIQHEYPGIETHGVVGDFEHHLNLIPAATADGRRVVALLGGTLGNFVNPAREQLLSSIAQLLRPGDHVLLGADLVKEPAIIEAAYNDSQGVTAEFNLNVLRVINRELSADFDIQNFEHVAFYDREHEWIEMRLRAREAERVHVRKLDLHVELAAGEEIRTEISAKFRRERLVSDLHASGLLLTELYTDPANLYGLALASPRP
jgi:L-histidine N-alpha-methyltransferase